MSEIVQNQYSSWQAENSGKWIYNGFIYVGQIDTDPEIEANQVRVFYIDENEQEVDLSQPIRTNSSGFPVISETNSTVIQVRTDSDYSVKALNRNGAQEWYIPKASTLSPVIKHNDTSDRNEVGAHDLIYSRSFNSISDLKSGKDSEGNIIDMSKMIGSRVLWRGYYEELDGGGNFGVVKSGSHSDDGGSIFSINGNIYVEADFSGCKTNIRKFGAKGDGLKDDSLSISNAFAFSQNIYVPSGTYIVIDNHIVSSGANFHMEGESITASRIIWNGSGSYITLTGNPISAKPTIKKITLSGLDYQTQTIQTGGCLITLGDKDQQGGNGVRIQDCLLTGATENCLKYIGSLSGTVENTQITKCLGNPVAFIEDGLTATSSDNTNLSFNNVNILNNNNPVLIQKLIGASFDTVNIEGGKNGAVIIEPIADDRVGDILFDNYCWFEKNFNGYEGSSTDELYAINIKNSSGYRFVGNGIRIANSRFVNTSNDGVLVNAKHVYIGPKAITYIDSSSSFDRPSSTDSVVIDSDASLISPLVSLGNEGLDNEVYYLDRDNGIIKAGRFDKYKADRSNTPQVHIISGIVLNHSETNDTGRTLKITFSDKSNLIKHDATLQGDYSSLARKIYLKSKSDVWVFEGAYIVLQWDSINTRWNEVDSNFYNNPGLNVQFNNNVIDFSNGPMQRAVASSGSVRNFTASALGAYVGKIVTIRYKFEVGDVPPTFDANFFDLKTDIPLSGSDQSGIRYWVCHVDENGLAHEIGFYKI